MDEIKKEILIRIPMNAKTYKLAKQGSLSANYSEIIRNGILWMTITKKLQAFLRSKDITIRNFLFEYVFKQIEIQGQTWLDHIPDYTYEIETKARISDKLNYYKKSLTQEEIKSGVRNYAEVMISLDKLIFAIDEEDIKLISSITGEIILKLFFKG